AGAQYVGGARVSGSETARIGQAHGAADHYGKRNRPQQIRAYHHADRDKNGSGCCHMRSWAPKGSAAILLSVAQNTKTSRYNSLRSVDIYGRQCTYWYPTTMVIRLPDSKRWCSPWKGWAISQWWRPKQTAAEHQTH